MVVPAILLPKIKNPVNYPLYEDHPMGVSAMTEYKDFTLNNGSNGSLEEYTGASATVLAIRNIILSRPENFPLTPSLGLDISKYEFDLGDSETMDTIKSDLQRQISLYVPSVDNVNAEVSLVEDDSKNGRFVLGFKVEAATANDNFTAYWLVEVQDGIPHVVNETY